MAPSEQFGAGSDGCLTHDERASLYPSTELAVLSIGALAFGAVAVVAMLTDL